MPSALGWIQRPKIIDTLQVVIEERDRNRGIKRKEGRRMCVWGGGGGGGTEK